MPVSATHATACATTTAEGFDEIEVVRGDRVGCLVTFNAPCSMEPPRYAVWLSHRNHTYRVALGADELIVHTLTHADLPLGEFFGGVSGMYEDKSAQVPGVIVAAQRC